MLKVFLNKRTLIGCLLFSALMSVLFMWRFTSNRHIPFFSAEAGKIYAAFVLIDYIIILAVFFLLFWLGKRKAGN